MVQSRWSFLTSSLIIVLGQHWIAVLSFIYACLLMWIWVATWSPVELYTHSVIQPHIQFWSHWVTPLIPYWPTDPFCQSNLPFCSPLTAPWYPLNYIPILSAKSVILASLWVAPWNPIELHTNLSVKSAQHWVASWNPIELHSILSAVCHSCCPLSGHPIPFELHTHSVSQVCHLAPHWVAPWDPTVLHIPILSAKSAILAPHWVPTCDLIELCAHSDRQVCHLAPHWVAI